MKILSSKKKINFIIISVLFITIVSFFVVYTFYRPTKFNYIIASKILKQPANSAFTDDAFYKCVVDNYNYNTYNSHVSYTTNLTDEQLLTITRLRCNECGITDATGLQKLSSLKYLYVYNNQLTSLDVSQNPALTHLSVDNNQLTSLDVSQNPLLEQLYVSSNQLTSLDVSHNPALWGLGVSETQLTSLDVSKNPALKSLNVDYNQLTSLDVSHNPTLEDLEVYSNQLTSLDVSQNPALEDLDVCNNQLTSLDVSQNPALTYLDVRSNKLTSLDVSQNPALVELMASNNQLTSLDVSQNPALKTLDATNNIFKTSGYSYINKSISLNNLLKYNYENVGNPMENVILNLGDNKNVTATAVGDYALKFRFRYRYGASLYYKRLEFTVEYNLRTVEITSSKYLVRQDYIYVDTNSNSETILNNLSVAGDIDNKTKLSIKNNQVVLKDDKDNVIHTLDIVSVSSKYFSSDSSKLYFINEEVENYLSNITCSNCTVEIYDSKNKVSKGNLSDKYVVKVIRGNDVLKTYNLEVGLSLANSNLNLTLGNRHQIEVLKKYNISGNLNLIYTSSNDKIVTVNDNGLIEAKALGNAVITISMGNSGYSDTINVSVIDKVIYPVTYQDGTRNVTEHYPENEVINLRNDFYKEGYTLIGWSDGKNEYLLKNNPTLTITSSITLTAKWQIIKPTINKYQTDGLFIRNIPLKQSVSSFNLGINNSYTVEVYDNSTKKTANDSIGTGNKIKISYNGAIASEYIAIIRGDVTGNGTSNIGDVAKAYQFLKGKITMEECYQKAANVVNDDNTIRINDIAKLYQFIKGKITSLEV